MEACSTLLSSLHSRGITSSLVNVKCKESFSHEFGCHFVSASLKGRDRSPEQCSKRQSLFSTLKSFRRNNFRVLLRGQMPYQMHALPLDLPFHLSLQMAPEEVADEHQSMTAICKDLESEKLAEELKEEGFSAVDPDRSLADMSKKFDIHGLNMKLEQLDTSRIECDLSLGAANLRSHASFEKEAGGHVCQKQQREKNRSSWVSSTIAALLLTHTDAFAAQAGKPDMQESLSEPLQEASKAPAWLIPAVLAFPVVSYFLFNIYRDRVNPYAKLSDWLFGVVVLVIIGNLITMATLGVRLY